MKILCVDDDEDMATLLENVLSANGHQVKIRLNGVEALPTIKNEDFNLIFLDLQMPGLSGRDVIDSLEKDGFIGQNNIVILSANESSDSEIQEFKQKGIKEILQKPIRLEKLVEVVNLFE